MPSQTPILEQSNKRAWSFLKSLRGSDAPINLVAIDPVTRKVEAITRHVTDKAVYQFIERYNGQRNLYFMVNTPYPDAPDNKLKKENVEFINAVWLDADPAKSIPFDKERTRLLNLIKKLRNSENVPTYIIDSGGGYQAFWMLKEPVLATPENVELYEAYSRSQAEKYGGDKVQNIERIMRVPFTWNLPTAEKRKLGRKKALAKIVHAASREGIRYD